MATTEEEAKSQWLEAWRRMPREERGGAQQAFAFIREHGEGLPTEWEDQSGEPWTEITAWLMEADEADGIEWQSL